MSTAARASVVSSFSIIKGSLIEETYTVFRDWDFALSLEDNLSRVQEANTIGATSEHWLRDVAWTLHRRFDPAGPDRPLVELAQDGCPYRIWKPLLLWHMARNELLLHDFLTGWLYPRFMDGTLRIRAEDVHPYLQNLHARKLIAAPWKASTLARVASGLLRVAADFGLLRGTQVRTFASYHLPDQSFLYLVHALSGIHHNAQAVVHAADWRMYLMDPPAVERELFRLHQYRKLRYEVAGSLAQLTLPCTSAAAYAKELLA